MELALKAKKRNFALALILTLGLIAGIPCIVLGAMNMGDNKGFVALLVFGIVGTVLGFYGSPLMWTRLATVNQELTVVQAVTQEHLYTVADLAQRLSVNGKTASATLNNCIRKGYLVGFCSHCGATVELTKGDTARCPYCGSVLSDPSKR